MISELRRLLHPAERRPGAELDADLRPEGKGGALIRTLSAYRNYYSRWSSTWEMQALVRADATRRQPTAGRRPDGADRRQAVARGWADARPGARDPPAQGPGGGRAAAARGQPGQAHQARARADWPTSSGRCSCCSWSTRTRSPALRTPRTIEALRAAQQAGLMDGQDAGHLEAAWLLASRIRNQIMLVRGRASDVVPTDAREFAQVAELLGYGRGGASHLLEDWQRCGRRAKQVADRLLFGQTA